MRTDDNASFIRNYAEPDAGRVKAGGGGGGSLDSDQPFACSVASVEPRSPLSTALVALAAMASIAARRRR
jgi:MYXO-CTERM domain-containing protein